MIIVWQGIYNLIEYSAAGLFVWTGIGTYKAYSPEFGEIAAAWEFTDVAPAREFTDVAPFRALN